MPALPMPDRLTKKRTVNLDQAANDYLSRMIPRRTGHGRFLSILLLEDQLRRELAADPSLTSQESWQATGVCLD